MGFLFILVGQIILDCISRVVYCSFGPASVIRYVISIVFFFANSMPLSLIKNWGVTYI